PRPAPPASCLAAAIPCVSGSPSAIVLIQAGRLDSGTLTPQKTSRKPKRMFDVTAVSRTRRPSAALQSPSPVHEKAVTAATSTSGANAEIGTWTPNSALPVTSGNPETTKPRGQTGTEHPK